MLLRQLIRVILRLADWKMLLRQLIQVILSVAPVLINADSRHALSGVQLSITVHTTAQPRPIYAARP